MSRRPLEAAIRDLLAPEIAGGLSAFDDVEILLSAWQEMHRERTGVVARLREMEANASRIIAQYEDDPEYANEYDDDLSFYYGFRMAARKALYSFDAFTGSPAALSEVGSSSPVVEQPPGGQGAGDGHGPSSGGEQA